jgi:membrane-associated phospholipid phosphatase
VADPAWLPKSTLINWSAAAPSGHVMAAAMASALACLKWAFFVGVFIFGGLDLDLIRCAVVEICEK